MNANLEADISYLKQVAEQGQKAPLRGGEHGMIWGGMFTASALYAYAVLTGSIELQPWTIAVAFIIPMPIGVLLTLFLVKSTGSLSFGNKTSAAAWNAVGIIIGVLYASVMTAKALGLLSLSATAAFGALQVTIFALYAVAYSTTAQVSQDRRQYLFAGTAVAASLGSLFTIGTYEIFLVMAAGIFASAVIPGFLTRSK
ncbi:MAG: hypothetical protein ISP98_07095 [Luminiphilus sp.]|nr:hypothetical protein [Luminiphilus sp.]